MGKHATRLRAAGTAAAAAAVLMAGPAQAAGVEAVALKTNAATTPLGIDDPTPELRWQLHSTLRAIEQSKYRVVVATTAAKAAAGQGDVWDSGEVNSAGTVIDYAGPALASRTRYHWSVRSWAGGSPSDWAPASWFETAYLSPSEWQGTWISGPARTPGLLTNAQALADDYCCLQGNTTLHAAASAGDRVLRVVSAANFGPGQTVTLDAGADAETARIETVGTAASTTTTAAAVSAGDANIKVASVASLAPGTPLTIDTGAAAQTVTITEVGTAQGAATTLFAPAAAGDTNVKVSTVNGFVAGQAALIDGEVRTVTAVGTQGRATTLSAASAAGDVNVKVASVNGISVGDTLTLEAETRTISAVGTPGATGTGLTLSSALSTPHAGGTAVRVLGTGITLGSALGAAHAQGASTRGLGTGVSFTPALTAGHAGGAAIASPGSGIALTQPLAKAHGAGAALVGPQPVEFCRPVNGSPVSGNCKEVRPAPLLRKGFSVAPVSEHGAVVRARVYASGLGWNEMTLNGTKTAERASFDPGFTSYDKTVLYTTDDVTGLIRQSASAATENVIASQLGSGRYDSEATSGNHGWERAEWRANPTLRADLHLAYADGTEQVIKSDDSWRTSDAGPVRYDNFDLGETYDARREIAGWTSPGFDAAGWVPARTVMGPAGRLTAQRQDRAERIADWPAGVRSEPRPRVYVWNTGQQRTGWATVSIHGAPAGMPIQIRFGEKLGTDGLISLTGYAPAGQIQSDYYIAKGTGTAERPETFAPRFTFNGFQYVQISGVGGVPLPDGVTAAVESVQEVRTNLATTGVFSSSSQLLNTIERITRASVAGNHQAGYVMDTPTYEKDGWTGDMQLMAPTASLMFDTQRQYSKTAQDLVDDQFADGQISLLTPGNQWYGYLGQPAFKSATTGSTPIWDALLFVAPWEAYQRYDDKEPLATAYGSMKKYLTDWIPQWFQTDGDSYNFTLTSGLGDWDPPTGVDAPASYAQGEKTRFNTPTVIAPSSTAYVAYMAKITADTARVLGKSGEAAQFETLYDNIKADYNAKWWDASVGYYRENATQPLVQTAQALPLSFGLVPEERRRGLQEKLVNDVLVTRDGHEMVGIAGSRWIFPALTTAAREGVPDAARTAYTIATQTTYPSYGRWVNPVSEGGLGWTGLGEYWEASSRTRNHEMFGSIGQWMYEELAGIQSLDPGYKRIAIRPLIANHGIDSASAAYDSLRGTIKSSWQQSAAGTRLDVTIPANSTGLVYVPGSDPGKVGEVGSGQPLLASNAPGVSLVGVQGDSVVYRVGSGSYQFRVGPGLFAATEATGSVGGTVGATLSLALGAPAAFGAFTPGVARDYLAATTANVISTAGDATLSVADPSSVATGRLVNGSFALPQALQARGNSGSYAPVGGSSNPTPLLTYAAPVSNDAVTVGFKQPIAAGDALRTGTYSKSLTFTLSTTTP